MNKDLKRTCTAIVLVINLLFGDVLVVVMVKNTTKFSDISSVASVIT